MGTILDQFLDFNVTAGVLSDSAGRALGCLISKVHKNKGLMYSSYNKLYDAGIVPIMDYCSGVWGYKKYSKCDVVQNKGARAFLGVHRFAPNLAVNGDMGWTPPIIRRQSNMVRLWYRFLVMNPSRLTKKIFLWDYDLACQGAKNWCSEVRSILNVSNIEFIKEIGVNTPKLNDMLKNVETSLKNEYITKWRDDVDSTPKLRTYKLFKKEYTPEPYVTAHLSRAERSFMAQFRIGILPLHVETGRYKNPKTPIEQLSLIHISEPTRRS